MAKVRFEGLKGGTISIGGKEFPIAKDGTVDVPDAAAPELIASHGAVAVVNGKG